MSAKGNGGNAECKQIHGLEVSAAVHIRGHHFCFWCIALGFKSFYVGYCL